ncbi:hypothetical protein ITI46_30335 [Streptomyces oryzae]|uniref:Type II secretion system protein GspF domain-containing protein n=1 Tax=Streptomyces oryzae TaxID=1434886 RepID=A0ABS3XKH1_9ACTN|nr:hypothetical protein [Streptomyces oryzae]MBO8195913.1 hypothetical protein [Streptomyces oryzae]
MEYFGITRDALPETVRAQRAMSLPWDYMLTRGLVAPIASMVVTVTTVPLVAWVTGSIAQGYGLGRAESVASYVLLQWGKVPDDGAPGRDPFFAVLAEVGIVTVASWVMWRTAHKGALRKYWLTQRTCAAVRRCADAKKAGAADFVDRIRHVETLCRAVEWSIWRSHLRRGGMPRRSSSRAAGRRHAARVIGALHDALEGLHGEAPKKALDDLAKMLTTIGEQHARGQVTVLLPESALANTTAVSMRSRAINDSFVIVRGIVAALVAAAVLDHVLPGLGVRDELAGWFLAGGALAAAVIAVGWRRVRDFLGVFPGL